MDELEHTQRRQPSIWWKFVLVALAGAIIGGIIVSAAMPAYLQGRLPAPSPGPQTQPPAQGAPAGTFPVVYAAERVGPSVVGIMNKALAGYVWGRPYLEDRSGSGVIITSDGFIVTNNHVVEGAKELKVFLADGRTLPAKIIGTDPPTDLAVIKIEATGLNAAQLGDSDALKVGELAVAIGNPLSFDFKRSVTAGVISGLNRVLEVGEEAFNLIQTDAVINPGNSGGPLCNQRAEVIGINSLKLLQAEGMGFAIPSNTVKLVVDQILTSGKVRRTWLGISYLDKATIDRYGYDISLEKGIYVAEVVSGSPAQKAGIKKDDVILAIDGRAIENAATLKAVLRSHRVGDSVKLTLSRKGQTSEVTAVLAEVPTNLEK